MSAEEALQYGLIDAIVQPDDEKIRNLTMPPPGRGPGDKYQFGKIVST